MKLYKGKTFAEVYSKSLDELYNSPDFETAPRGYKIKENTFVSFEIENPDFSIYENERRSSQLKYIAAELIWYFRGGNNIEFIKKFASFWENIANDKQEVNSAYGNLIFKNPSNETNHTQYDWALNSLVKDKDSRQAIMHFNMPLHQYNKNKDFVCTMYGIFHIRNNKLNFKINMRSNDAILGTPTDVAFFSILHKQMLFDLKETYPDLELGYYIHEMDSYHIYERHYELVESMLENSFTPLHLPDVNKNLILSEDIHQLYYDVINDKDLDKYTTDNYIINWIIKHLK